MAKRVDSLAQQGSVRETFRHTAIYSGANVLGRMISFFMLPFYAHILRGLGYGVIGMIDAALTFLSSLFGYQLQNALVRIYHEQTDEAIRRKVIPTGITLVAGLTPVILVPACLLSKPLSNLLLGSSEYWYLFCLAIGSFYCDMIFNAAQTVLVIQRRSITYSLIGLIRLITGISLSVLFIVILRWDLPGYFLANLATAMISAAISISVATRIGGFGFSREVARSIIGFQAPLVPGSLVNFFSRQIERVLVRYKIDLTTVGILEMAYKFPVLIAILIIMPFMKSWETKRTEIAEHPDAPERIGKMFTYFLYMVVLGGLLMAVDIATVLKLLTPEEFWIGYRPARVEIMRIVANACFLYLQFGLYYRKRTGLIARIQMVTSVIKIGISYFMIATWGIYGAAWSGFLVTAASAVWGYILAQREYPLRIEWRKILLILVAAAGVFMVVANIDTATFAAWTATPAAKLQAWFAGQQDSWLGTVKDGKVLALFVEKTDLVFDLLLRTLMGLAFLAILPWVYPDSLKTLRRRLTTLGLPRG